MLVEHRRKDLVMLFIGSIGIFAPAKALVLPICPHQAMNHRTFFFLVNPIAGTRSRHGFEDFVKGRMGNHAQLHFVYSTPGMKADEIARQVKTLNVTDLVAVGGDGTVNIAAEAIINTGVRLGILPFGSGNGLARTAGIPMKAGTALNIVMGGNTIAVDAFRVNDRFSCMLCGLGLDAAIAEGFSKSTTRGFYAYTKQTLIQFFKAKSYRFEIELPGHSFETEAFFFTIANSNQFGNNVTIAPKASLRDGLLDVVIVKRMMKANIPLAVIRQLRGDYQLRSPIGAEKEKNVAYLQTPSLIIHNPDLAPLHIDGDPMVTSKLINVQVLPAVLTLIVP